MQVKFEHLETQWNEELGPAPAKITLTFTCCWQCPFKGLAHCGKEVVCNHPTAIVRDSQTTGTRKIANPHIIPNNCVLRNLAIERALKEALALADKTNEELAQKQKFILPQNSKITYLGDIDVTITVDKNGVKNEKR